MAGRGLLSRIAGGGEPLDEAQAIAEHLRALLNTRRGDAACAPSFGVVDFTDLVHAFPRSIQDLSKSLRATIAEYEPRLKNVLVRHVPDEDPLTLRFEISAQLAEGRTSRALRFSTMVHPGGRIDVA